MSAQAVAITGTQTAPRMRLTRRGRFVFFGLPAALLLAAIITVALGMLLTPAIASDTHSVGSSQTVVVQPGDTVWAIAQRVAPGRDTREVVGEIARLNDLKASEIVAGQDLFVPAQR
ncbi:MULTISPECIES: LysM peptidoglycan-binding domain-containing protein [Arthrobacter]|uniref:LysM peptidoglycan-binding domain-containing protein n=1 Tax=Arthrobacter TaxID=1663 RepID=UPI001B0BE1D5|nr:MULTISPECIES: LysM peptidoglycan-binding domain-containing protein [Arthrobacter]MBO9705620.1 LysM peptidoglycan-binding domain-containing protein [Arthrobacter sp.]MDQ0708282.1 DNA-binding MurR/RpiR family transcriptional regulator [Arthrobacter woluwensis]WFR85115.1 LysM peptidoglycan-binding domain-containing protein [Arthrobacter sp. Y-9]